MIKHMYVDKSEETVCLLDFVIPLRPMTSHTRFGLLLFCLRSPSLSYSLAHAFTFSLSLLHTGTLVLTMLPSLLRLRDASSAAAGDILY